MREGSKVHLSFPTSPSHPYLPAVGLDQGLLARMHFHCKRWRPHQWIWLLFHSLLLPGQFLNVWPVTTTCSQVLAPLHAHLQFSLLSQDLGWYFIGEFSLSQQLIMSWFAQFRHPFSVLWGWPQLFRVTGFCGERNSIFTSVSPGAGVSWRCAWWSVSMDATSMCWWSSGYSYAGSKYPQTQTFSLILRKSLLLNPSVPKVFSLSYRCFMEKKYFKMFLWSLLFEDYFI